MKKTKMPKHHDHLAGKKFTDPKIGKKFVDAKTPAQLYKGK